MAGGAGGNVPGNRNPRDLIRAFSSITSAEVTLANFQNRGVAFDRISGGGGAGNVPTIVAGWLPAAGSQAGRSHDRMHDRSTGRNLTGTADAMVRRAYGNTATVLLEELAPESFWGVHGISFTLVDAEGNLHPYATIRNVQFNTNTGNNVENNAGTGQHFNGNFVNQRPTATGDTNHHITTTGPGNTRVDVAFSADGRTVDVFGMRVPVADRNTGRIQLEANFGITAYSGFSGPVYVMAHRGGQSFLDDFGTVDLAPVHIADVRLGFEVDTQTTQVQIGFQEISVADITITEVEPGDFRTGQIRLGIGEYMTGGLTEAVSHIRFVPIPIAQTQNHLFIGGAPTANQRVMANLAPIGQAAQELIVNITRPTQHASISSYIELRNLAVRVDRAVPYGTFELLVRGSAVMNNDEFNGTVNGEITNNANTAILPGQAGHRRYAHMPRVIEDYVLVVTPGHGQPGAPGTGTTAINIPTVSIAWAHGTTNMTVDGTTTPLTNAAGAGVATVNLGTGAVVNGVSVPADRVYVPLRAIIVALGGEILSIGHRPEGGVETITVSLGGQSAVFTVGATTVSNRYGVHAIPAPVFIGNGTVGAEGTTYLPISGIHAAFSNILTLDSSASPATLSQR